ncbi:TolC family protein [Roseimarinus sediminis]|uniref:TolC family protein n=1 Tax=Roseimarinus sediminis TaxID=1610899 RepID=UPI003D21A1CA
MKHIILLFFIFSVYLSFGQQSIQLSLTEAQEYAIEHNLTLKNARLDLTLSDESYKEAVSKGLPQIDANLDWMTYFGYEMEFSFGGDETPTFTAEQLSEAASQTMNQFSGNQAMGLEAVTYQDLYNYQAGSYYNNMLSSMIGPTTIKMTDASTATLQIGQLLFSGQYWAGIKLARLGKEIAEKGLENSMLEIREAVTNSYMMVLVTRQTIETFEASIANLEEIMGHTRAMYENGMAEPTDVDQLSMQVTMLKNNLRSMNRGLKMTQNMLKFQLGIDTQTEIILSNQLEDVLALIDPENFNTGFSFENSLAYQLTQSQTKMSEEMLDMEKWAYAPTITGFYTYNQKLLTTGFDMTPNHMAGVTLSLPVFSGGTRKHKVAQAKIELEKAINQQSMVEEQLKLQEEQLLYDLKTAAENYQAQGENVEVAKRVYQNIQNKYEQGMASSLDLTQSNSDYLQAESNYIQSVMSLIQAKVALDKLYNQL